MDEPAPAPCSTRMSSPAALSLPSSFGYQGDAPLSGRGLLGDTDLHGHHLDWGCVGPRTGRVRGDTWGRREGYRWSAASTAAAGCGSGSKTARVGGPFGRLVRVARHAGSPASSHPCPMRRLRWLSVVAPVVAVAVIELVSDGLLDEMFPFPLDTIVVVVLVAVLAWVFSGIAFGRIDRSVGRAARAQCRSRAARGVGAGAPPGQRRDRRAGRPRRDPRRDRRPGARPPRRRRRGPAAVRPATGWADCRPRAGRTTRSTGRRLPGSTRRPGSSGPISRSARLEAPLQRAGETIGLLMVGSRHEHGFEVDEVETLSSLANQAAIATENARLQARLRELAVVAERERIAREMHDGLAQVLGYVNTKSQAIEELLAAGRTDEARSALARAGGGGRASIYVDVREAILGLRSPVVPGARASWARSRTTWSASPRHRRSRSASTRRDDARRLELAPDVEAQVFRIVQEALTNVRKHCRRSPRRGRLRARRRPARRRHRRRRPRVGRSRRTRRSAALRVAGDARAGRQHRRDRRLGEPAERWLARPPRGPHDGRRAARSPWRRGSPDAHRPRRRPRPVP